MNDQSETSSSRLPFREWSRRLVYAVRRKLLEPVVVKASDDGSVTIRLGARLATIKEDVGVRAVSLAEEGRSASAETLTDDERGDAASAEELADSVVGYFASRR